MKYVLFSVTSPQAQSVVSEPQRLNHSIAHSLYYVILTPAQPSSNLNINFSDDSLDMYHQGQ